jgi:putative membrane-bound dehydrogenase-like protein
MKKNPALLPTLLCCLLLSGRAAGDLAAAEPPPNHLEPRAGLKPFDYEPSPVPLPNYTPGGRWGAQSEPIRVMQKPLSPEESMQHLVLLPGFSVKLFAAEPDIAKPIWMSWDERGRLWIAETFDYPNNMQPAGQGHDRIVICEDTDGDGRADKFTVVVDKLSVPTSFVLANGGVIVVHSGKTEFFKETDGRYVGTDLFRGWGTGDTHAGPSNLRYGFDNWIWGVVGYSGFNGTVGGKRLRFGQGIYRFKADGSALEFIRSSNNNTWGLGFTEDNLVFGSTANGNASMFMPIPNRYYEAVGGWSASRLETIADSQNFYPITDKVRQVDWFGKYTAGAGSAIYTARNFPSEYWNRVQFVNEPTGHLLGKFNLEARGAGFVARNDRDFLASDDEWTAPICAEVGPDGALWMIDWYNYIIQHNPVPNGFKNGKGGAYETPLRDKIHGRIYRVTYNGAKSAPFPRLDGARSAELVAALKNDNMLWRMTAQRLLVQRGDKEAVPGLCALVRDHGVDALGLNPAATHALWTLKGLGVLEGGDRAATVAALGALKHPAAGVRRAALMVLPRDIASAGAVLDGGLLEDGDAQTRLAALLALSELPSSERAGGAVFAMLQEKRNSGDQWLPDAATAAAARNDAGFIQAALAGGQPGGSAARFPVAVGRVVQLVTANYAQRGPVETIVATLSALKNAPESASAPILEGLVSGWPKDKAPALSDEDKKTLGAVMEALPDSAKDRLLALAQRWGQTGIFQADIAAITGRLKARVNDSALPDDQRIAAAGRWVGLEDTLEVANSVLSPVGLLTPPDLATGLIRALAQSHDPQTGQAITAHWSKFTPSYKRAATAILLHRADWCLTLLDAIENKSIPKGDLPTEQWSQLKLNPNQIVSERARALAASAGVISADRAEIVAKLLPLAKEKGDSARGREVFTANCAVCHTFNGQGGKIGPELTGLGARDRGDILIDILDPNRSVEANYRLWNVTTKSGETYSGRLEAETQTTVEILDVTAQKHVVQRKEIAALEGTMLSIMPNGFEALPPDDIKSLLEYLTAPAPPGR